MIRPRHLLLAVALVALVGTGLHEARVISNQSAQRQALLRRTAELERELADLRRQRDATTRELQLAEQQLAQLPAPNPAAATDGGWVMREIASIDEDYDTRHSVSVGGSGSSSGPAAWIEDFQPRMQRAFQAYAAAHQGAQPTSITQALPYIDPPFAPAVLEKLLKAERNRAR